MGRLVWLVHTDLVYILYSARRLPPVMLLLSVCVLCGSPVWPSPPVVGPLRGPPLCVGPLCVGSSPVVFSFHVGIYSRDVSRSCSRSCIAPTPPRLVRLVPEGNTPPPRSPRHLYSLLRSRRDLRPLDQISADVGPVGEGPYWLTTKQESSPERLTGCDHPNCPPRTTRATSVPHGIRTLDLVLSTMLTPCLPLYLLFR